MFSKPDMAYSSGGFSNPFGFVVTPWVKRLLIANGVAFLFTALFAALVPYLVFTPARVIPQFWTVITYMFVHVGFWHLLFNMLALFFFGPPLEERWGSREFVKFYFFAGMGGAALSVLFPYQPIAGASAAVYGIMVAFAMYWPDNPIYIWGIFPVKAKYLVGFIVGLSVFFTITGGQATVAHLAHLGGAIFAFAYLKSSWAPSAYGGGYSGGGWRAPAKPKKESRWTLRSLFEASPGSGSTEPTKKKEATPRRTPTVSAATRREMHRALDDVDRILEKISAGGMSSLTEEERRQLEEASKKFRTS
jgi:membrane associated rhomboid family serine protease